MITYVPKTLSYDKTNILEGGILIKKKYIGR